MSERYALVAVERATGRIFVSPETLNNEFTKAEVEEVVKFMPKALKDSREFLVMPYGQAVSLWMYERDREQRGSKDKEIIH